MILVPRLLRTEYLRPDSLNAAITDSLKCQAVVSLACLGERYSGILGLIRGAVFLGVPNFGMNQAHLEAAVQGQPNAELIQYLRLDNEALLNMDRTFANLAAVRHMKFLWGYETLMSPATFVSYMCLSDLGMADWCYCRERMASSTQMALARSW